MASEKQEEYDLEKVYDEKIAPHMTEILKICKENKIPMLASFAYKNSKEEVSLCTSYVSYPTRSPTELLEAKLAVRKPSGFMAMTITSSQPVKKA